MSTTNVGFIVPTLSALQGATVQPVPSVQPLDNTVAKQIVAEGFATRLDRVITDLATAGYAKNGAAYLSLTGSTAITIDATALAAATGVVVGGDTSFATVNQLVFVNTGSVDLVVSVGSSNPFNLPLAGTSPTLTVPAGSAVTIQSVAGFSVDSTHKTIKVTPTSGGSLGISFGGA